MSLLENTEDAEAWDAAQRELDEWKARALRAEAANIEARTALNEALDAIDAVESEPGAGSMFKVDWTRGLKLIRDTQTPGSDLLSALKKAREALKYATDLVIATGEADNRCAEALRAIAKYTEGE